MESHLFEDVLMDLKIISMVNPYQKVSVVDNRFSLETFTGHMNTKNGQTSDDSTSSHSSVIETPTGVSTSSWYATLTNGLYRMLSGQKRKNVLHKLRQRVTELENYLRNDLVREPWIKKELKDLHQPVIKGLRNLQLTYSSDSQTYVHLDVLATRLESIFKDFDRLQTKHTGNQKSGIVSS